jgi:hypothetical protein
MDGMKTAAMILCALILAVTAAADAEARWVTIDRFSDAFPHQIVTYQAGIINTSFVGNNLLVGTAMGTGMTDATQQDGLTLVQGGQRDATLTADPTSPARFNQASMVTGGLRLHTPADGVGARLVLEYGNRTSLNEDWSDINDPALRFDIDASNLSGSMPVSFTLVSGKGTGSQASATVPFSISGVGEYLLPLSNFSGIDLSDVDTLTVDLNGNGIAAADVTMDDLQVIPEPATIGLLGLGLVGVFARRRQA